MSCVCIRINSFVRSSAGSCLATVSSRPNSCRTHDIVCVNRRVRTPSPASWALRAALRMVIEDGAHKPDYPCVVARYQFSERLRVPPLCSLHEERRILPTWLAATDTFSHWTSLSSLNYDPKQDSTST